MAMLRACAFFLAVFAANALVAENSQRKSLRVSARLLQSSSLSSTARTRANLDQVIQILINMMKEFRRQENDDRHAWEGYQSWSDETTKDRNEYVRQQEAIVMSATATLNAKKDEVGQLTGELSQLASDLRDMQGSIKELIKMRHEEHESHVESLADLTKTINAVGKATEILEGHYHASGAALAEIKKRVQFAMTMSNGDETKKNQLTAFLQSDAPDWLNQDGAQQYGSYQKQGGAGGVIGTLSELRSTIEGNRQQSIDEESTAQRDFEDTKRAKEGEVARMTHEQKEKTEQKADAEATISMATAAIDSATTNKADALTYLEELRVELATFGKEYDGRVVMRQSEIGATQAALDALQSVSAGAKDSTGAASFLQTKMQKNSLMQEEAKKLKLVGKKLQSTELMKLSTQLSAKSQAAFSPEGFEPVKQLLEGLIARLEAEASAETSHHDWCEAEKESSESARGARENGLKELEGAIERLTTETSVLKSEIMFMTSEIARVEQENRDATANREEQHETFVAAKRDHDEVISAISTAMEALGGQYGLLQLQAKTRRQSTPFASYSSGGAGAASATEMLEDLLTRYSEARAQLVNDEKVAKAAYDELIATNTQFLEDTEQTKNTKIGERRGKISQLSNDKAEHEQNFLEMNELGKYLQDLRPSCDDIRTTFEERKKRREAEISALQGCLDVLSNPNA